MGAVLTVMNDRSDDFEILHAKIFTPGQGMCLQHLIPNKRPIFKFDHSLTYGSWYDIQIIGQSPHSGEPPLKYLKKGIYLSHDKTIKITTITDEKYKDCGPEWKCGTCNQSNFSSVAICEYCYTNKSQTIISVFSCIPIVGIPFLVTDAVLRCGKAAQSNKTADKIDAGLTTTFAVIDVITAPFIVGSLIKIPAKIAAENGTKFTVEAAVSGLWKPLLIGYGKEFGEDGIIRGVKVVKEGVRKLVEKVE